MFKSKKPEMKKKGLFDFLGKKKKGMKAMEPSKKFMEKMKDHG